MESSQVYVFVLVADGMLALPKILHAAFTHPWVESYQIGFGPPLVRSTTRLAARVRDSKSAFEKLEVYLEHCIMDAQECKRLAELQRRLLVRRMGPVEAESLAEASRNALDLRIWLQSPLNISSKLRSSFESLGLDVAKFSNASRAAFAGHFLIRLDDPRNTRLFQLPELKSKSGLEEETPLALELRTVVDCREYWSAYLEALSLIAPFTPVEIGDPRAWAKVLRDGRQL